MSACVWANINCGNETTGDLQSRGAHIVAPRLVLGEGDTLGALLPAVRGLVGRVEHILAPEPRGVRQIVLRIAYPGGREHLGHILGAVGLILTGFQHTGLHHSDPLSANLFGAQLVVILIASPSAS